jgi:N-acetylmuramate 1-kinase
MDAPTTHSFRLAQINQAQLERFAQELAFALRQGDVVSLAGDLGAGKTTLARALVRALTNDPEHEVPSPTFTLVQTYESDYLSLAHFDLYRLSTPEELDELGFEHLIEAGAALVEWPQRALDRLPAERLELSLAEPGGGDGATRDIVVSGHGAWAGRARRLHAMHQVIRDAGFDGDDVRLSALAGDASSRRYGRLTSDAEPPRSCLVMDWPRQPDGPPIRDGLPYSQVAKLAEDVRPFLAIAQALRDSGLSAPSVLNADTEQGFIVLEDLGALGYAEALAAGARQDELWRDGVDALLALRRVPADQLLPVGNGEQYQLPRLERAVLEIETDLVPDWLWEAVHGTPPSGNERDRYHSIWAPIFERILAEPTGWMLRDYHSPNLLLLAGREGARRVGIIDFQDALQGPAAYDLVSLLQDARLDVAAELESELLTYYCKRAAATDALFDEARFRFIYAALGAQRSTKILGIFTRLARRDGKPRYLAHLPRIWGYLERNLAHPELSTLAEWYEDAFPGSVRRRALAL